MVYEVYVVVQYWLKKYFIEIFYMNRKEYKLFYIRLFVDILSCILGILLVTSFDNCFLGILSSESVDFFLNNEKKER
jgi:hypothetical protein